MGDFHIFILMTIALVDLDATQTYPSSQSITSFSWIRDNPIGVQHWSSSIAPVLLLVLLLPFLIIQKQKVIRNIYDIPRYYLAGPGIGKGWNQQKQKKQE